MHLYDVTHQRFKQGRIVSPGGALLRCLVPSEDGTDLSPNREIGPLSSFLGSE